MYRFTDEKEINELLNDVLDRVKSYADRQAQHVQKLNEIGTALSAENDLEKLLEMILVEAKEFTNADGGTLYLMSRDERQLLFTVVQTDSLKIKMGGTQGKIEWPPVNLYKEDGEQNREMVAALCALDGKIINIPDVYHAEGFNFEGTKKFDQNTGYRSQSMLVIPMRNYEKEIIGVLQLLNRQSAKTNKVVAFSVEDEQATLSLASQAAVAITNAQLVRDLEKLLESFIKSIADAIDEKSPYTGGHIRRVAELTMMVAEAINHEKNGKFGKIEFDKDKLKELYIAAWMHDIGKITTPEFVVDKATKLETIHDRIETIETRFQVLLHDLEIRLLKTEISSEIYEAEKAQLMDDLEFIKTANIGGEFMSDDKIERIHQISKKSWRCHDKELPLLDAEDVKNLTIRKGTLTDEEREKIQAHASVGKKMLEALPFPKKLSHVPEYAAEHHEKLSGKGYPLGLTAEQIPLEARILALADVFEALTAADRPYKKAKTLHEVSKILGFMVKDNELDADLVDFFFRHNLHLEYAQKELKPEQLDS